MLKRPIRYTDFDGNDVTEEFYFNISKSELLAREMKTGSNWSNKLMKGVATKDSAILFDSFEDFILWAYGEREDSSHFNKSPEISQRFRNSAAYDALFMELTMSDDAAAAFLQAVMPKELVDEVRAELDKKNGPPISFAPPAPPTDPGFAAMQQAAAETHILPGQNPS